MTPEQYHLLSLGRDPYEAMRPPLREAPPAPNPFNPMPMVRGVGDMLMGALQDMGNIGDTSFHSAPTQPQPSFIGSTIDSAKDPVGTAKATVDSMMPYSEGGFVNLASAIYGPKAAPKVAKGAKEAAVKVVDTGDKVIAWMKPSNRHSEFRPEAGDVRLNPDWTRRDINLTLAGVPSAWVLESSKNGGRFLGKPTQKGLENVESLPMYEGLTKGDWRSKIQESLKDLQKELSYKEQLNKAAAKAKGSELGEIMQEAWETQGELRELYNNLRHDTSNAGKSGLFNDKELAKEVHPLFMRAQNWFRSEELKNKRNRARAETFYEKPIRDNQRMLSPELPALPIQFTRPIMPDHGRGLSFTDPILNRQPISAMKPNRIGGEEQAGGGTRIIRTDNNSQVAFKDFKDGVAIDIIESQKKGEGSQLITRLLDDYKTVYTGIEPHEGMSIPFLKMLKSMEEKGLISLEQTDMPSKLNMAFDAYRTTPSGKRKRLKLSNVSPLSVSKHYKITKPSK